MTTTTNPSAECVLSVQGMKCGKCVARVENAAKETAGVSSALVDREQGRARVAFDPAVTSPAQIASAITAAGHQAAVS